MSRMLKELVIVLGGVTLGVLLLLRSSFYVDYSNFAPVTVWGYPLPWLFLGRGYSSPIPLFGVYYGEPNWFAFDEDLLFWLALALSFVEASFHFPYLRQQFKIHRSRQVMISTFSARDSES